MQRTLIGAAVFAALTLTGFSAHAGCADPRTAVKQGAFSTMSDQMVQELLGQGRFDYGDAAERIVGTWDVTYITGGAPGGEAFIQWHRDGTEWENVNFPILGGNICLGSWKRVDETHVFRNHIGWLYTNGILTGYFTETETDEVAHDGKSYTGINEQKIYDLTGKLQFEVPGTSSAKRIAP